MRSNVSVNKGKGKAPAPKRKIQEGRPQQETSSEDEIEAEPNENIQDEDEEPTQREQTPNEGSDVETSKTTQQMDEKICEFFEQDSFFYDLTHESYKDRKRRDVVLAEFAAGLGSNWTGDTVWKRIKSLRTDYGKIKALQKKGKSGSGAKKFTRKQQWKLRALQFLDPYSRKGVGNSEETELGQIPIQPDDDDLPPLDDALVTPTSSTSTSAGFSQRKQPSKKPQGSSDLASVLKEVWAADRAREDDVRKSVQDLGKPPDARQAWAAWFTSVCQDVPDERFREFQQETFTVSMRYLMAPTQQQVKHQPMWQQAPMTQVIQPMWQQTPRPQQHWQTSPQIPQQHIQPFPQQSLSYTPTQDVQSYTATSITTGEMGTSSSNLRFKSAPPTSNILHQAFDATGRRFTHPGTDLAVPTVVTFGVFSVTNCAAIHSYRLCA